MSRPVAPAARMARELLAGCRSYRPTEDSPIAAIPQPRRPDRAGAVPIRRSEAALRYVNCDEPGLTRRRCGRGFAYFDATGAPVRDPAEKRRVAALAVPPAWTDVWLCIDPRGHIQATGRDEKGRKQYIYHPEWREQQERSKYTRLADFARVLGRIRRRIEQDLAVAKSDEPAVLAAAAQLLDLTGIRVGNRSYFEENGTVGLTTLESRHATIDGARIGLRFKAKSGKLVEMRLSDRRLARILLRCEELPGQRLFRYRSAGTVREVDSARFNDYLREVSGTDITAKDFRTWIGTVTVVETWIAARDRSLTIKEATTAAARRLANTPAITRRSYIHPKILEITTTRAPSELELRSARRAGVRLAGSELLCARLLADGTYAREDAA